ncbi:hypothetical protein ASPFODRAFT_54503 [Aspergillus luchuensis CBS 106.47]|uniref:Uncharacterized protein n=1 Tax=Aspergillus luchuensis (strain CBS 106.47) TaxID=1137211 RepID=A0A1M3SZ88_ASPLC|nr:hypothetical protein ASPFODRAFT_54503 [Aspergillus luchuensis CBS 106.47]
MAREIAQGHLSKRRGKLAVGVCARQSIRQQAQDVVQPRTGPDIKFFHFDFEPGQVREAPCRKKNIATAPASSDSQKWIASRILEGYRE